MFSRLSAFAALFAILTTATLAVAASLPQHAAASAQATPVIELPVVVVRAVR